jgi:hypothetical protein
LLGLLRLLRSCEEAIAVGQLQPAIAVAAAMGTSNIRRHGHRLLTGIDHKAGAAA